MILRGQAACQTGQKVIGLDLATEAKAVTDRRNMKEHCTIKYKLSGRGATFEKSARDKKGNTIGTTEEQYKKASGKNI